MFATEKMKSGQGRILILAPHIDDEIFGPFATCYDLAKKGNHLAVFTFTSGIGSYGSPKDHQKLLEERAKEANAIDEIGKFSSRHILPIPTQVVGHYLFQRIPGSKRTFYQEVLSIIRAEKPDLLFTISTDEPHPDHKAVGTYTDAAVSHARENLPYGDFGAPHNTPVILEYSVNSSFSTNDPLLINPVSEEGIEKKIEAAQKQFSQLNDHYITSLICNIRTRAEYWGFFLHNPAAALAEAFRVKRGYPIQLGKLE